MSRVLETYIPAEGGDFTGTLPQSVTDYRIAGATGKTRLTWRAVQYQRISGSSASVLTAKYFYIYLDDIRVSIVSQ